MATRKVGSSRRRTTEEPRYRDALVSYVDILGFRALLSGEHDGPGDIRKRVLEVHRHLLHEDDEGGGVVDIAFSDTVLSVSFLPGPADYHPGVLYQALFHLHLAQIELLGKGILIRGGLALGGVFIDDSRDVWFGPGIVSAYELETNADFPRIVLDRGLPRAFDENPALRSKHNTHADEAKFVRDLVRRDVDGMAYIDPFSTDPGLFDDGLDGMIGFYQSVRRHLVDAASRYTGTPSVLRKYAWLANRYEATVSGLPEAVRDDLSLSDTEFPGLRRVV